MSGTNQDHVSRQPSGYGDIGDSIGTIKRYEYFNEPGNVMDSILVYPGVVRIMLNAEVKLENMQQSTKYWP